LADFGPTRLIFHSILRGKTAFVFTGAAGLPIKKTLQTSSEKTKAFTMSEAKAKDLQQQQQETANDAGGVSGQRLKAFIERVERLEEEKTALADDIKDIFAESKAVGFDTKIIRKVIRLRKMDKEKRQEEEELLELYKSAIGME